MDSINHPEWVKAEESLKSSMTKEIDLMREILSNMIQEEHSLLNQNKSHWEGLMQGRFQLIEQVKIFRQDRLNATNKLISLSDEKTFEKILSDGEDIACDVIFLLDQLISLSEKINTQNSRNQVLSKESQHFIAIPLSISYPHQAYALPKAQGRKKFLMTIP
jgi:hypothetical protein